MVVTSQLGEIIRNNVTNSRQYFRNKQAAANIDTHIQPHASFQWHTHTHTHYDSSFSSCLLTQDQDVPYVRLYSEVPPP